MRGGRRHPGDRGWAGTLHGVEAVVDKDLTSALPATAVAADALLLLTDIDAVIDGYGTPGARPIRAATPDEMRGRFFPPAQWALKWTPPAGLRRLPAGWLRLAASRRRRRCCGGKLARSSPRPGLAESALTV
jgi:hypothetical protein